jgi:hypothetical protein
MAAINVPNQVNKFTALEMDFGTTICPALWKKAAELAEYVNKSYPIGMLMFFNASQSNIPAQPDPLFWQFCDGSAVTNTNSPLLGQILPDFRNKFFRHPSTGETFLSQGGADSVSVAHDHGGMTGLASDWDSLNLDNGPWRAQAIGMHQHTIAASSGSVTTIPAYHELQVFVRIA